MNNRLNTRLFVAIALLFIVVVVYAKKNSQREKVNFNIGWKLNIGDNNSAGEPSFDDTAWKNISLPYAWNQEEAFNKSIHDLSTGIAWYRKHFKLPKSYKKKKVFIEFEGVRQGADFYVNGNHIGYHENGVMAVGFDITDYVNFGNKDNVIAVRTDNDWRYKERVSGSGFQWNNDNFNANYGGIPKNVYLHVTDKIYQTLPLYSNLKTTGTYVYASNINIEKKSIQLNAGAEICNETSKNQNVGLKIELYSTKGELLKSFEKSEDITVKPNEKLMLSSAGKVNNIEFWSWGYGYLYDVKTSLIVNNKVVDEVVTRTGFRKTAFKDGMFYLNDRVLQLKGYAQRTSNEWPAIGMSCPPWMSDFSNRMIVEGNGNFVRWMHVTPWKQDVESCDRVGLIQAMPAGDAEKDVEGRRWEQRLELMRDAIIYNRNNPSIIFYEGGNESISDEHMAELKAIRDKYDPYGGRAIGSREMLDSEVAEYGGEMLYINKSADIPMWAMEYSRDEGLRKYWDEYSYPYHKNGDGGTNAHNVSGSKITNASVYNRNQDSHAIEDIIRWYDYWEMRPGTGRRVSSGGANIIFSDTNTHFRGAENYRRSGEVDPMRIPKDNFWAHKVMWDNWVDIEKHHSHIIGHWNYSDSVSKDIFVVSTGDKVELFVNGHSKGFGQNEYRFLNTYKDVQWEAGLIKAVSYDKSNNIVSVDSIQTVDEPNKIKLTLLENPSGMKANGADYVIVEVEVVDQNEMRCPVANNLIKFNLSGEGEWIGGIAQGPDNYILAKELPVECGINRVMVRSTNQPGKISLIAKADGLLSDTVNFETQYFKTKDGLSSQLPSEGLDSYFGRGPTPKGVSYKVSKIEIPIESATAGFNNDEVNYSFDDNELTEWRNDGSMSTGWITYKLKQESELDECIVKLTGWRRRQYPIQIFIDGQIAYSDTTKRSLGYVTLPLGGLKGNEVSIKLIGANTEQDAFGQITELNNTNQELDLYRDPNGSKVKGQLRIVEVEFLKKVYE